MAMRRFAAVLVLAALVFGLSGTAAAGANVAITSVNAPSFTKSGETVKIEVTVKNTADTDVHQMEVRAGGFGQVKEQDLWGIDAGEEDTVHFFLDAPADARGTHEIDIVVQSRDKDGNVIGGETRTISIDVEEEGVVVEPEEGDLRLTEIATPASVMAGDTIPMDVTVKNTGGGDMSGLHVAVDAFGRTVRKDAGTLPGNAETTVRVNVPVPGAATGRERAEITVSTFDAQDAATTTIDISSVQATLQLRQKTVETGEHVTVSGILTRRNTRADLFYAGRFEAPVFSDETGHYTHTIIPEKPGVFTVMLSVGDVAVERLLTVKPRLDIGDVSVPTRVGVNSVFDVCVRVSRAAKGTVELRLTGANQTTTATVATDPAGDHCFSTALPSRGNHTLTVEATSQGVTVSEEAEVMAVDTGLSASIFPDQLTLTEGQAGVFQVDIANDRLTPRQFNVSVDGLEGLSVEGPGTVTLGRGESTSVVVRVVPGETGIYNGTITVSNRGTVITQSAATVRTVQNPALKNPVIGGAARAVESVADTVRALDPQAKLAAVGGTVAAIILTLWYRWRRHRDVIEPQY